MKQSAQEIYAALYDSAVPDWPGEIDFYRHQVANLSSKDAGVLEIACGTGWIALRLAQVQLGIDDVMVIPHDFLCTIA